MIGLVLAAGAGSRLRPTPTRCRRRSCRSTGTGRSWTSRSPTSSRAASTRSRSSIGYAADRVIERVPALERRYGLHLEPSSTTRPRSGTTRTRSGARASASPEARCSSTATRSTPSRVEETLLAGRGHELLLALDDVKPLGDEEMKVQVSGDGLLERINKGSTRRARTGEYIGADADRAGGRGAAGRRARGDLASAIPQLYYEDGFQELADRGGQIGVAPIGEVEWVEVDDHARPGARTGDRMPLLTRMIGHAPVDRHPARRGRAARAAARRPPDLERRSRRGGRRARPGRGDRRAAAPAARERRVLDRSKAAARRGATSSRKRLRAGFYDALVGIGGGRTLDVAKHAAVARRAADGGGRHQPRARRHRLAGRVARGRRPQGLATACRCRSPSSSTSTTSAAASRRCGAPGSATWSATSPRSPTGSWPSASAASRSTASPSRSPAPPRRRSCTARTGSTTTTS